jgi:hypothetical protein
MADSLRMADSSDEQEVGKFLDKYFYPQNTSEFIRYNDKEHQLLGIDTMFSYKELNNILVDEKAATHYINKDIPTFAFEINFVNSIGALSNGWLFDSEKKTQYYLVIWVKAKKDKGIQCEDITELDCLLIERLRIIEMLKSYSFDAVKAEEIAKNIRSKQVYGVSDKSASKPFYFYYTHYLAERPINVIIWKSRLIALSAARFIVKPT